MDATCDPKPIRTKVFIESGKSMIVSVKLSNLFECSPHDMGVFET